MINLEVESESVPETEDSLSFQHESIGRLGSGKKLKKMRSIRFPRFSSMRSTNRRGKSKHENLSILSSFATESSEMPTTPIEMSDSSPHYMKGTSSSHAKESFQNTQMLFTTVKLKRSLSRKISGRNDVRRKLKSSRSIKIGTLNGQKSTRKVSESICDSDDTQSYDGGNKPQRVLTRRLSLKPVRILAKMPTSKSRKASMDKGHHHISLSTESCLHRATCSSTLKDSHFSDHNELPLDENGSQEVSAVKVCPYSYCSLHGHRHKDLPPLKRFMSMRRRQLKAQRSMKMDGRAATRSNKSGNSRKVAQKTGIVNTESGISNIQNGKRKVKDSSIRAVDNEGSTFGEGGSSMGEDEENNNFRYDAFEKSTLVDVVKPSSFDIEILEGEVATSGEEKEGDNEVMQVCSLQKEAKPAYRIQEGNDRYMKMWHLVYKHAMLGNPEREEKHPNDGNDKRGVGKGAHSFDVVNSSSIQDQCERDQAVYDENKSVIDLVQKAFDEILLPETEDLASDDGSKSRGSGPDEELLEKNEDKTGEGSVSISEESPKEDTLLKDENLSSQAEEITGQGMGSKPDQKTPKSWSNLKKLILLRRFVKALDKVRKLNFRQPRHLPLDSEFEAEKVFLKRQTAEEKQSADEWMLDYALQKVISKLEPAQRQRVSLLVEAFETILPFQDAQNAPLSSATIENRANPVRSLDDSSNHSKKETEKDNACYNTMPELHNSVVLKERCLESLGTKAVENISASGTVKEKSNATHSIASSYDNGEKALTGNDNIHHEETPFSGILSEVPEDSILDSNKRNPTSQSGSPQRDFETKIDANTEQFSNSKSFILKGLVRTLGTNLVGSGEPSDQLGEPKTDTEERTEKDNILMHEQSEDPNNANAESETQPEKQNYTGLWYLVYKHMVSGSGENDSKLVIDGADGKESEYEGSRSRDTSVSCESTPMMNQGMDMKDHGLADQEVERQQLEAIKMVEEAIDSIIPDDLEHTPDRQLITENTISVDGSKQSNGAERVFSKDNQEEPRMAFGNGITEKCEKEDQTESKEGNNPDRKLPRSWSNLRKVILLRRFIKSLEKVRKFNPRGPRYLPIELDPEAEKVNLRHLDMAGRKGTEEWMLDYALRQVVSQLTPARKRKVGLLVEAFETVMPTMKN
ncbi:hypothetical protein HN51_039099 [Arachis hypogaea]|uniref:Calmodulin-binding domain-containing protein n=1 Tax=Arachis hypogaea TaxID=3818 RepID=A0A444YHM7_ARAHY|nr:uncharacterized protein LOC107645531 [Arachis ipaensis]XP_025660035.1 calmodulin binding protein PICBP [Arachis hypogaea]RYR01463.1 hypothetical protein Ahy_B06g080329 [Arachis hypogaea]